MTEFRFVYITTKDREEARRIGRLLVESRLAACVNVIDGMESIYHWRGEICEDSEAVLIAKARAALLPDLINRVKTEHSYDCPCIVALSITAAHQPYLDWLQKETAG